MSDDEIRRLLEVSRPREEPPTDVRDRVYAAAHRTWRELPSAMVRRTQTVWYALASGIAAAAIIALYVPTLEPNGSRVAGEIVHAEGGHVVEDNSARAMPHLAEGASVLTSRGGRVLVRLDARTFVRLDGGTRLTLHGNRRLVLHEGRLFTDSTGPGIVVETPAGVRVNDVGTQFDLAVDGDRVTVGVREGRVNVAAGGIVVPAAAREGVGEVVTFEDSELASRQPVPTTHARWDWIHSSMPAFDLEAASVHDFLVWATREAGLELAFADEAVRRRATAVRLHGPPIPAGRIQRSLIRDILATAPSFRIASSPNYRLVVDLALPPVGGEVHPEQREIDDGSKPSPMPQ